MVNCSRAGMLNDRSSELDFGFNFHLCPFQRIVVTSEHVPFYAIGIRRMWTIKVIAVQIGRMAIIVPPGSFVHLWAIATILVIVVIYRRKLHTTKKKKNKKKKKWQIVSLLYHE